MRGEMPEKKAVVERRHRISLVRERLPFSPPLPLPLLSPRNSEFRIFPPSPSVNLHFPLSSPHSAQYFFSNHRQCCTIRNMRIYIYICTWEKLGPCIFSIPAHFSLKLWRGNGGGKGEGERENKKGSGTCEKMKRWNEKKKKERRKKEKERGRGGMTIHLTFSLP